VRLLVDFQLPNDDKQLEIDNRQFLSQFGQHGFHLAEGVEVAGAAGGGYAVGEHGLGVGDSAGAVQGLGGHEIACGIVGIGLEQDGEFGQGAIEVALPGVFHRKTITGEGVARVLGEDVVQGGDTVHRQWSVASG
jgi:hypothetical protein